LTGLISKRIGDGWIGDLAELRKLEAFAQDAAFREEWQRVKRDAKVSLARGIARSTGVNIDPDSMIDAQAKRIHEHKRQHLNVLHVITLYTGMRNAPAGEHAPRPVIFAGKAAPAYRMAKLIIKLINSVADVVNNDPAV